MSRSHSEHDSFDVIFAGGGTTACVVAGRLAEADPSLKILVLEDGGHTRELQAVIQPIRCIGNLALGRFPNAYTHHISKPNPNLANRILPISTGRLLGGGSSVNFMMYSRASASDYDDWETKFGNKGWGSKDLIPLLKKAETYQSKAHNDTHGESGPIKVSFTPLLTNITKAFLTTASEYDQNRGLTEDLHAFFEVNKYGRWPRTIDANTGRRSDTPHHYIYSQNHNQNLVIMVHQRVVRVVFEGTRAVGVEYVSDSIGRPAKGNQWQTPTVAYASRLVVVSAGSFGSPAILERSGIGASKILKKNGVTQIVNLPGVGEHYLDHIHVNIPYVASDDSECIEATADEETLHSYFEGWCRDGQGPLSQLGLDAGIKYRPTEAQLKQFGPEFRERWKSFFAEAVDKPISNFVFVAASYFTPLTVVDFVTANSHMHPDAKRGKAFSITYAATYPTSSGSVHITSGLNPYGPVDFDNGLMGTQEDLEVMRFAYKITRELARRNKYYRGELGLVHPTFPPESEAITKVVDGPVTIDTPDITYTSEDDQAIDDFHRQHVNTDWHSSGTCAMMPRERGGVVDSRLNVYGVTNLKVADLSILPTIVGAHTHNTALAVGEKAAIIIAENLGIGSCQSTTTILYPK